MTEEKLYKFKKPIWHETKRGSFWLDTKIGSYIVWEYDSKIFYTKPLGGMNYCDTIEEGKRLAENHYFSIILEALEPINGA